MTVRTAWHGQALLGEGPAWDPRAQRLWFVDIKGQRVHRLDPVSGAHDEWPAPAQVGWVLPAEGGRLLAGLQTGLAVFDPADGHFTALHEVEPHLPLNRLNDATVGADGVVWFGSMHDGESDASGLFYRWDGNGAAAAAIAAVSITNGPALSPDGRTLYHVDTAGGMVHAADIADDGTVSNARPFAVVAAADGFPDGVTTDSAGNVWLGLWGGWRARLYSPAGEIIREVRLPAANVTKIALGGADLRTAYATTARAGLDAAALAAQPEAGSVFAFEVEVPGMPLAPARLRLPV